MYWHFDALSRQGRGQTETSWGSLAHRPDTALSTCLISEGMLWPKNKYTNWCPTTQSWNSSQKNFNISLQPNLTNRWLWSDDWDQKEKHLKNMTYKWIWWSPNSQLSSTVWSGFMLQSHQSNDHWCWKRRFLQGIHCTCLTLHLAVSKNGDLDKRRKSHSCYAL